MIIGLLGAVSFYGLRPRPGQEREYFVMLLNELARQAWQQTMITHKLHRILFDFKQRLVRVEVQAYDTKKDQEDFKQSPIALVRIPAHLQVQEFFIEGIDEIRHGNRATTQTWIFLVPDGLTQEVVINIVDTKDIVQGKKRRIGLVLNPFNAQFTTHGTFQKPSGVHAR